jgi:isochorismate synthase EntC
VELAGLLHPTPAVGGEPRERAVELIPALEGLDRGWYAGPIGWTDLAEDGEFCVALRCALLRDDVAHLYAGDGIVRDSVPAEELAETEVKLAALLPLLTWTPALVRLLGVIGPKGARPTRKVAPPPARPPLGAALRCPRGRS